MMLSALRVHINKDNQISERVNSRFESSRKNTLVLIS